MCEDGVQQPRQVCLVRVLAWDCWQELPSGVTVTGTRMTAGLKCQFMSCELQMEDQKLSKWKNLNSPTHQTLVPTQTKKKPSRWRMTEWRHFTSPSYSHHGMCLFARALRIQTPCLASAEHLGFCFNPLSKNLGDNSSTVLPTGSPGSTRLDTSEPKALLCEVTPYD